MAPRRDLTSRVRRVIESPRWGVGSVIRVATVEPVIVMTFDDGPEPTGTTAVLDALAHAKATATFFVLMTRVRRNPSLLAEIVAAGHEIGLHGADHRALPTLGAKDVYVRCRQGRLDLEDAIGRPIRWMRPPYGRQTPLTWAAVRAAGLTPVLWGATSWDWKDVGDDERIAKALTSTAPGTIVLNHDAHAGPEDGVDDGPEPRVDRSALMALLLMEYRKRGLVGRSLGDALSGGALVRAARFTR